jgi:hypothetical protein
VPRDILHFLVGFVEVVAAIAGVIIAGLLITLAGLWLVPKMLGATAEQLEDSDPDEEPFLHPKDDITGAPPGVSK